MNINFWGVVYGTKAFLPYLQQANEGHIVNVSSFFGIISAPAFSAYNASKFAVRGFTEALRQELEVSGSHVSCTTIHPGGIRTNIAKTSRVTDSNLLPLDQETLIADFDRLTITSPAKAADTIINGIVKNKRRVLIGKDAQAMDLIQRFLPTAYQHIVEASLKLANR